MNGHTNCRALFFEPFEAQAEKTVAYKIELLLRNGEYNFREGKVEFLNPTDPLYVIRQII